jgi:hypothetical protein
LLYIIESIINEKLEGYTEYFTEKQDIFNEIKSFYFSNKKITDILNSITGMLNGETRSNKSKGTSDNKVQVSMGDLLMVETVK